MFDQTAAVGGVVGVVGVVGGGVGDALARLPLQYLEHSCSLAGVLRRRSVEAWLEGVTSQLFSIVRSVVSSLLRSGGLIDPQSSPLGQRCGRS